VRKKGQSLGAKTVRFGWIDGRKINVDVKARKEWFYRGDDVRDREKPCPFTKQPLPQM
jgi:hypothetical protein